LASHV